jgi:hypothetical protein
VPLDLEISHSECSSAPFVGGFSHFGSLPLPYELGSYTIVDAGEYSAWIENNTIRRFGRRYLRRAAIVAESASVPRAKQLPSLQSFSSDLAFKPGGEVCGYFPVKENKPANGYSPGLIRPVA